MEQFCPSFEEYCINEGLGDTFKKALAGAMIGGALTGGAPTASANTNNDQNPPKITNNTGSTYTWKENGKSYRIGNDKFTDHDNTYSNYTDSTLGSAKLMQPGKWEYNKDKWIEYSKNECNYYNTNVSDNTLEDLIWYLSQCNNFKTLEKFGFITYEVDDIDSDALIKKRINNEIKHNFEFYDFNSPTEGFMLVKIGEFAKYILLPNNVSINQLSEISGMSTPDCECGQSFKDMEVEANNSDDRDIRIIKNTSGGYYRSVGTYIPRGNASGEQRISPSMPPAPPTRSMRESGYHPSNQPRAEHPANSSYQRSYQHQAPTQRSAVNYGHGGYSHPAGTRSGNSGYRPSGNGRPTGGGYSHGGGSHPTGGRSTVNTRR